METVISKTPHTRDVPGGTTLSTSSVICASDHGALCDGVDGVADVSHGYMWGGASADMIAEATIDRTMMLLGGWSGSSAALPCMDAWTRGWEISSLHLYSFSVPMGGESQRTPCIFPEHCNFWQREGKAQEPHFSTTATPGGQHDCRGRRDRWSFTWRSSTFCCLDAGTPRRAALPRLVALASQWRRDCYYSMAAAEWLPPSVRRGSATGLAPPASYKAPFGQPLSSPATRGAARRTRPLVVEEESGAAA